jgi:hypothetical protein
VTLFPQHLAKLRGSTFTDETIAGEGDAWSSIDDPVEAQRILNWDKPAKSLGPCLKIRFRNIDGSLNCFARLRPDNPRIDRDGKPIKYEQPAETPSRAFFPAAAIKRLRTLFDPIALTEGELKAVAMTRAGIPTIGLTGLWNAFKKGSDESVDRELIDDLHQIDWFARVVLIVPDFDPRHNPSVSMAAAEIARVLSGLGAEPIIIDLPPGPPGPDGIPTKQAADDYLAAHGDEALHRLIDEQVAAHKATGRPVEEVQQLLGRSRVESLSTRGVVFLDRSPAGSGKSTADNDALRLAKTSLTVLPSHRNCEEREQELLQISVDAARYPKLSEETCRKFAEAGRVMGVGLSVSGTLCPSCEHRHACCYKIGMASAEAAAHRIATHKRAELSFEEIAKGREYITVHEDPCHLLRPTLEFSGPLEQIIQIAKHARYDRMQHPVEERRMEAPYFWALEEAAVFLRDCLQYATDTADLELPTSYNAPATADATLWAAIKSLETYPDADAMRACKALAAGDATAKVRVDHILRPGRETDVRRSIVVVWQTAIPSAATIWISDATADPEEIAAICGLPIVDATPGGKIAQRHPVLQIPVDLKKATSRTVFVRTLCAAISRYPTAQRIGVICDRAHLPAVTGNAKSGAMLPEALRNRIVKTDYFRGTDGRASNAWQHECDLLVVAGTPRVPPSVVKSRLIRAGRTAAAARPDEWVGWGWDWWSAVTISGDRRTVKTLAYRDHDWRRAYRNIVRAELEQCIGRGRSIRESGIPVVVITTDDLGLPLIDDELPVLGEADEKILLAAAKLLTEQLSKETGSQPATHHQGPERTEQLSKGLESKANGTIPYIYLDNTSVSSQSIATVIQKTDRFVRQVLCRLEKFGFVTRKSSRSGWSLTETGWHAASPMLGLSIPSTISPQVQQGESP